MLVVRPDFPVEDTKKRDDLIAKLIKDATILDITVLGKKQLAYPIRKQTEGIYILLHIQGDSIKTGTVQKEAKLGTDVIRFLLIQKEG
jgi:ribosomal protein S6